MDAWVNTLRHSQQLSLELIPAKRLVLILSKALREYGCVGRNMHACVAFKMTAILTLIALTRSMPFFFKTKSAQIAQKNKKKKRCPQGRGGCVWRL
jgi:hypothetical protein